MKALSDGAPPIGPAGVPRQVTARATWLLAPNASPMTFDGTNSWVLPFDERIRRMIEATVRAHLRYLHDRRRLSRPVRIDG